MDRLKEQKRAILRQYMLEPIARRTLTETECLDHVIAEFETLDARELGFGNMDAARKMLNPSSVISTADAEHTWAQIDRRVR